MAIYELPKLPTRGKKRAAGATYHAGSVFFYVGINDGWRAAAGASKFFRHLTSLNSFKVVMPTRTPLNKRETEIIVPFGPFGLIFVSIPAQNKCSTSRESRPAEAERVPF